jgi:hypothetical protein
MSTQCVRTRSWLALAVVAVAAATVIGAAHSAAGTSLQRSGASCKRSSVPARIGGKRVCLRAGQRCKKRYERVYRRHGFHCQSGRLRRRRKSPPAPPPPPPPPPLPPVLNGSGGLHSILSVSVPGAPVGAGLGFGSFWVRTGSGYDLYRIEAATGQITADIPGLPQAPFGFSQDVEAGERALWASNINAGSVSRIDPATNRVVATIPVWPTNICGPEPSTSCSSPMGIAFTPGAVWVVLHHEWKVVRIDPATNTVVATISLGSGPPSAGPQDLTAANGFVYAGGDGGYGGLVSVEQIDPATNAVTPLIAAPTGCDAKAASGTHVWLGVGVCGPGPVTASLQDIDTISGSIVGSVALTGSPYAVAIGWGSVWALTGDGKLNRVDPATRTVTGTIQLPDGRGFAAADAGQLWLAVPTGVYRIGQ